MLFKDQKEAWDELDAEAERRRPEEIRKYQDREARYQAQRLEREFDRYAAEGDER